VDEAHHHPRQGLQAAQVAPMGSWPSTGTSVSYRWSVFSRAFLLEKMSPKEDNYMKREVG